MAKKIAILEYSFIFDPSETWPSGYEFESSLAQYYAKYGIECQIVETAGGTGRRVIYLSKGKVNDMKPDIKPGEPVKRTVQAPPKDYKKYQNPKHPDTRPPKVEYNQGKANRGKVRYG